jgi:hypothetical protein
LRLAHDDMYDWEARRTDMKIATTSALMVVRTLGLIQLGLGVLFWTNNALNLIPLHMLIGLGFVLALWVVAGLGLRAGGHAGLASATLGWGLLVLVLGMTQMQMLPGDLHWIVEVVHLGVGLAAMGLAEALGRRIRGAAGRGVRSRAAEGVTG